MPLLLAIVAALSIPIVGGSPAALGDFPDVVVVAGWTGLCSGTLVAPDVVLTAGHCIAIDPQAVLVGSVDYGAPAGALVRVASAIAYPDWEHSYDVAVLVLATPVAGVAPRTIAAGCALTAGDELRVIGFGLTDPGGSGANTQLETTLVAVDDATCDRDPACRAAVAPDGELVAGGSGRAACFGDSGGPLLAGAASGAALVGVVSRAIAGEAGPCSGASVYVRADAVAAWIEHATGRSLGYAPCAALDAPTPVDGCATSAGVPGAFGVLAVLAALAPRSFRRCGSRDTTLRTWRRSRSRTPSSRWTATR